MLTQRFLLQTRTTARLLARPATPVLATRTFVYTPYRNTISEKLHDLDKKAGKKFIEEVEKAEDVVHKTTEKVKEKLHHGKAAAKDVSETAKGKAKDTQEDLHKKGKDILDDTIDKAKDVKDKL